MDGTGNEGEGERHYGIGDRAPRKEDRRLLTGAGRYADDVRIEGALFGHVLRAPEAHGDIARLETGAAAAMPGVRLVLTAQDLIDFGCCPFPCKLPIKGRNGEAIRVPTRHALAHGRVRFAGEPVAFVVADTQDRARDAAEAIDLEITPRPVLLDPWRAADADAPAIHDSVPGNVALDWTGGDEAAAEAAFAAAAHVTRLRIASQRVAPTTLEPRSGTGLWDGGSGRYTLYTGGQGVFGLSRSLAELLGTAAGDVRVRMGDVGGSFGMKGGAYPEHVLCLVAARLAGCPVRWRDDRTESFLGDAAGRDIHVDGELALDGDGRILGLRLVGVANMGAFVTGVGPLPGSTNILKNGASLYRIPAAFVNMRCVLTNQSPVAAYRGAGRPDANLFTDRLVDRAARETGRDPAALRRLNLLRPDELPWTAVSGQVYGEGDFPAVLDRALAAADTAGLAARRAASAARGRVRGRGLACYLEATAPPGRETGGIRFEADGGMTFLTGTKDFGQGHETAFAQILGATLGLSHDRIGIMQGDSDALRHGGGTGGSRSLMASGKAAVEAAAAVVEKGRAAAAHFLEAAAGDIEFDRGQFRVVGTDRAIALTELAARTKAEPPPDAGPEGLDVELIVDTPPSAFPNGCHICEVELDPETGALKVDRYVAVGDFGTIVNPMLVEGQIHGGAVQGLGQALMEAVVLDADGQCLSGSLMDYCIPRATDLPPLARTLVDHHPVPTATNPLGVKGCGEAGTTGALPAVANAVADALQHCGAGDFDMPATPHRLWRLLNEKSAGGRKIPVARSEEG